MTADQSKLFIACKFGPDKAGNYIEDILTMTDYALLCEGNESFCKCDQNEVFDMQDGELVNVAEPKPATNITVEEGNTTIALIIIGIAVCLVALAIILLIIFIILRGK